MNAVTPVLADNQTYYFVVGRGRWRGTFEFRLTDRRRLRGAGLGVTDRALVFGLTAIHRVFGRSTIDSEIWAEPESGVAGVAGNTVRISKFGITLYLLRETYTLDADGTDVEVHARERFGPVPFLLNREKRHPAVIRANGMSSTYYIPLLGADWVATYTVHEDRRHIDGDLVCDWADAREIIHKLGED